MIRQRSWGQRSLSLGHMLSWKNRTAEMFGLVVEVAGKDHVVRLWRLWPRDKRDGVRVDDRLYRRCCLYGLTLSTSEATRIRENSGSSFRSSRRHAAAKRRIIVAVAQFSWSAVRVEQDRLDVMQSLGRPGRRLPEER